MKFLKFLLLWISQNLAVPFWVVGHIHLTVNIYHDIVEVLMSFGMNILVGIGFWINWLDYREEYKKSDKE